MDKNINKKNGWKRAGLGALIVAGSLVGAYLLNVENIREDISKYFSDKKVQKEKNEILFNELENIINQAYIIEANDETNTKTNLHTHPNNNLKFIYINEQIVPLLKIEHDGPNVWDVGKYELSNIPGWDKLTKKQRNCLVDEYYLMSLSNSKTQGIEISLPANGDPAKITIDNGFWIAPDFFGPNSVDPSSIDPDGEIGKKEKNFDEVGITIYDIVTHKQGDIELAHKKVKKLGYIHRKTEKRDDGTFKDIYRQISTYKTPGTFSEIKDSLATIANREAGVKYYYIHVKNITANNNRIWGGDEFEISAYGTTDTYEEKIPRKVHPSEIIEQIKQESSIPGLTSSVSDYTRRFMKTITSNPPTIKKPNRFNGPKFYVTKEGIPVRSEYRDRAKERANTNFKTA